MTLELIPAEDVSEDTCNDTCGIESEIEKRFKYVINYFQKINPNPTTELKHKNGYELLVATILSIQCTDKRVNMITPDLFEDYPTPDDLAKATPDDIYQYISSCTFANNKSDYLVGMAKILVEKYHGNIPADVNKLQKLPGVGRKTANVIVATLFNKPTIAVDTHVMRVSDRIGLTTDANTPLKVEEQLVLYTPKDVAHKMSHWLILHGRYICTAKDPRCPKCGIREICRYYIYLTSKKLLFDK
jgi:endonuclease-3